MKTICINDRVSYQGEKATVKQVWKKKVKLILSDLREMTVGIDEIRPADEAIPGQLPLINLSAYQLPDRPINQWDLENEGSIAIGPARDESENSIAIGPLTPEKSENLIADIQSLTTDHLIILYESITRELIDRGESLPNHLPNSLPNSHPNHLPNSLPNHLPNSLPNHLPNSLPNHGYEEIKIIKGRKYRYWRWTEQDKLRSKYLGRYDNDKKSSQ